MKLLVTGAAGFLGAAVVAEGLRRGHEVRGLARRAGAAAEKLEWVATDLRSPAGLADIVRGCDAVIHLAATKTGDLYGQLSGTVVATENLLAAMTDAGCRRMVGISSLAVYDYLQLSQDSLVTEDSPLDLKMAGRDDYARTKLMQEQLIRQTAMERGWQWTILRPGVIYGRGNLLNARVGIQIGSDWIVRMGGKAPIPLTYVENCAQAVLLAAERGDGAGQILNIIDDDPPTQERYARLICQCMKPRPTIVPVPWTVLRWAAEIIDEINHGALADRAKIPGLLIPSRLHARCKPLRYTNERAKWVLGWKPRYTLTEALLRISTEGTA